ncbi:MAG: methylcrotonoyl-CoA carboxylase, partial [Sinobacterium sp.]
MATITSKINAQSSAFSDNQVAMQALVDDLHAKVAAIKLGGGESYQARHIARGKLLARDRIDAL